MRWFWGLLILALVAALGLMFIGRGQSQSTLPAPLPASGPAAAATEPSDRVSSPDTTPKAADLSAKPTIDAPASTGSASMPPQRIEGADGSVRPVPAETSAAGAPIKPIDPAASVPAPSADEPAPSTGGKSSTVTDAPQAMPVADAPVAEPDGPRNRGWAASGLVGPPRPEEAEAAAMQAGLDAALGLTDTAAPPAPDISSEAPEQPKPAASVPASEARAKLEVRDDGTTLVDGRFVLKGKGTHAEPHEVSWELLVSAQETYQPRLGRKTIPDRLKMLDGKWVRIAGYIAFPIMAQSQDEMLMMLNQWDGCCIGVPPTPYDAIEVKLKAAAKGDERLRASGSVTGILRVDPYLVKDWLVSLYLMDDAELTVEGPARADSPTRHQPAQ